MSLRVHHKVLQNDVVTGKEKSFLDQALKHHSSAQAAIKVLQEQLEQLDELRKSTRENSLLKEEKDFEKSTSELLSSTNRYLINSPGNRRNISPLSSTINNLNENNQAYNKISTTISPIQNTIRFSNHQSKESFASETLPLSSSSLSYSTAQEMSPLKNTGKQTNLSSFGGSNLTEILGRLVYGEVNPASDKSGNASDELISVLEKISHAGEVLQLELKHAKTRESTMLGEIQNLRSKINNSNSPQHEKSFGDGDIEMKCKKLEDAMLSLQEENMKLNRLLKETNSRSPRSDPNNNELKETKRILVSNQSENKLLRATIDRMQAQLAYYEECHNKNNKPSQNSSVSPKIHAIQDETKLKEKIKGLENEVNLLRNNSTSCENLETRLNELRNTLVEKNDYISQCEKDIEKLCDENKELHKRYDDLQHGDIYKRKEVLQLCDKFEQMKAKYLKLENEVLSLQKKDKEDSVNYRSAEDFLKSFFSQNETLHMKLESEQRELARSRDMLEKDYDMLKSRYDDLLSQLGGLETSVLKNRKKQVGFNSAGEANIPILNTPALQIIPPTSSLTMPKSKPNKKSSKTKSEKTQSNLNHRRRYTTPNRPCAPQNTPNCLRARSTSDVHKPISTLRPTSCSNLRASSPDFLSSHPYFKEPSPYCSCGYSLKSLIVSANNDSTTGANNLPTVSLRSHSSCDRVGREKLATLPIRSKSEVMYGTSPSPANTKDGFDEKTPYTSEYLSNMDGVQLLVSFGNSGQKLTEPQINEVGKNTTLGKSSLKSPALNSNNPTLQHKSTSLNDSSPLKSPLSIQSSFNPCPDLTTSALPSILTSNGESESSCKSSSTEKSLHLSDLPCDATAVVDKFRNFDDYSGPPPVINGGLVSCEKALKQDQVSRKEETVTKQKRESPKSRKDQTKKENRNMKQLIENRLTAKRKQLANVNEIEENDAVDQSSASTTRDHMGRIEFLRNIQINSGMRLHGLMADTSITDAVLLNESDLNGEIRLGLSNHQEAYADKLVRKYTKNAGKILDLM